MTKPNDFLSVIEAIFSKLMVRYGAAWRAQWAGLDMSLVHADWAEELAGFARNQEPLRYAMRHLPERPPTVAQFRAIANTCPPPGVQRLPAPAPSAESLAEARKVSDRIREVTTQRNDPKAWARRHIAAHERGEWVRPITLQFACEALGLNQADLRKGNRAAA